MSDTYSAPLIPGISNQAFGLNGNYGPTPNPFFSIAGQWLPRDLKGILQWVRYITAQSPVTTEVLRKLSTFPITNFTYSTDDAAVRAKYEELVKTTKLKQVLHDVGFQYFTAGNVFLSLFIPFVRTIRCSQEACKSEFTLANAEKFAKFENYSFTGKCPKCGFGKQTFVRNDQPSKNVKEMNVVMWDPLDISVNHNPLSGKSVYYYRIPAHIRNKIKQGDFLMLESIPWEMVEAVQQGKEFRFAPGRIYHLKNIDTGFSANGIAVPPMVSHFSLVFYQATLRKANEAIAAEFMSPIRVIYPAAATNNGDPVVNISMRNFAAKMEDMLKKSKKDKSHVTIAPVPIGYQAISGEGKTLLVAAEIAQAEESLLLSLGVSRELLSGTTNWTSSTVGLRLLKNTLDSYVGQILEFMEWLGTQADDFMSIGSCQIGLTPFQLTDDESLKNIFVALMQQNGVSMTTVYESMGRSYEEELERMLEEAKAKARMEVRMQFEVQQAKYLEGTKLKDEKMEDSGYIEILQKAQVMAQQLMANPAIAAEALNQLLAEDSGLYFLVHHLMQEQMEAANGLNGGQDPNDPNAQGDEGEDQGGSPDPNADNGTDKARSGKPVNGPAKTKGEDKTPKPKSV